MLRDSNEGDNLQYGDSRNSCSSSFSPSSSSSYSSSFGFSRQGVTTEDFHLHLVISSASSSVISSTAMSFLTASINLLFDLPRFRFPDRSILIILPQYYSSCIRQTSPDYLSLLPLVFSLQTVPPRRKYSALIRTRRKHRSAVVNEANKEVT